MGNPVKKLNWWHMAIVDWELQNPAGTHKKLAKFLKMSEGWLSQIYNSDLFQDYRAERMKEHQERLSESVIEKAERVTALGLDVIGERIESERKTIGLDDVQDVCEMGLNALGFGKKHNGDGGSAGNPVNIFVGVDAETLKKSRGIMRDAQTIEGEAAEIEDTKALPPAA
ncbi:hypothetical protein CMI37_11385 [Candidatus Pacearchaeota archaeon]|nr:hypothetical protein [Candidatus Pacearchaeota archaeon]